MAAIMAAGLGLCLAHGAAAADRPTYRIVDRIPGRDGGWDFAAVDASTGRLYVAHGEGVERVDLASRRVVDPLAPARHAHQVLALDGGRTIMVSEGDAGMVRFYAADTGAPLGEVATGVKPDAAFYDAATNRIAVMNAGDGTVALLDARTRALVGRIAVGGALEFGVADGRGGAYVNVEDANAIARLDLRAARRVGTVALPGCEGPTGLALVVSVGAASSAEPTPTAAAAVLPPPVAAAALPPVPADTIAQQLDALEKRFAELAQTKQQTDTALEQVRGAIIALRQLTAPKE